MISVEFDRVEQGRRARCAPKCAAVVALLAAASVAQPGLANAQATTDPVAKQTADANALANLYVAQKALATAQTQALGLPSYSGETTLGTGAGSMETWILWNRAVGGAAERVAKAVATKRPANTGQPVAILSDAEVLSVAAAASVKLELSSLSAELDRAQSSVTCLAQSALPSASPRETHTFALALAPVATVATVGLGALLGLFKQDTTIQGTSVTPSSSVLVDAVAGQQGVDWIIPSEAAALTGPGRGGLGDAWIDLSQKRDSAFHCRTQLAQDAPAAADFPTATKGKKPSAAAKKAQAAAAQKAAAAKSQVAILDGAIAAVDEFETRVVRTSGGTSQLAQAVQWERVMKDNPLVLRLKVEQAGGTLIQRKNILTTFGYDGVRVSGGMVASYRLVDPKDGTVKLAGTVTCRTESTQISKVHSESKRGVCD